MLFLLSIWNIMPVEDDGAAARQNQPNDLCAQRRLRTAWAPIQSNQRLRCALYGFAKTQSFFMRTAKTDQTGWIRRLLWDFVVLRLDYTKRMNEVILFTTKTATKMKAIFVMLDITWASPWENVSSGLSDQVRLKLACSATEASTRLEILVTETRDNTLSRQRTTKTLIRLHGCVPIGHWIRFIMARLTCLWHDSSCVLCDNNDLSSNTTKPTKWPVSPAKTQISLSICPVWSVFAVRRNDGSLATH